jgi:hypothetical protein
MYYELGLSATVLFICFFISKKVVTKISKEKQENDALKARLLRKVTIAERMLHSFSLPLPNETLTALNRVVLKASRHLELLGNHSSPHYMSKVERRIDELDNSETGPEHMVIPSDDMGRKLAMQDLFRLHQFFRHQIKIGDSPVVQFKIEVRRIEMAMLDAKIKRALMAGSQAKSLHKLGSARERFDFVVKILERNQSFIKRFANEYRCAKEQLTLIKAITSPRSTTAAEALNKNDLPPPEKERDGLDRMFSDEKSTWVPQ